MQGLVQERRTGEIARRKKCDRMDVVAAGNSTGNSKRVRWWGSNKMMGVITCSLVSGKKERDRDRRRRE